jgi:hypothetical protein
MTTARFPAATLNLALSILSHKQNPSDSGKKRWKSCGIAIPLKVLGKRAADNIVSQLSGKSG